MNRTPVVLAACATALAGTAVTAQPPSPEILVNVSWGDQIVVASGDACLDTPERIRRAVTSWRQEHGATALLWRASAYVIREFYERRRSGAFVNRYYDTVEEILRRFDPLPAARESARREGLDFLLYMTVFDHGAPEEVLYAGTTPFPWQDRATIEHPEWQTVDLEGRPHWGVIEMAFPEARRLLVDRIADYVRRFEADGVYVCTRTHSLPALHADQFGFSPPIVAEYQRRHGIDITADPRFDWRSETFRSDAPELEQWRRLRGEYLVQFHRELRRALDGRRILLGIPRGRYLGPPYGNLYLDWERLVGERLVDGIVLGPHSGKGLHPKLYVPHAGIGYLSSEDDAIGIPTRQACVASYGPLCSRHGVGLYLQGCAGAQEKRLARASPSLHGFMIGVPSGAVAGHLEWPAAWEFGRHSVHIGAQVFSEQTAAQFGGRWPRILSRYDHSEGDLYRGWEWILLPTGQLRFRVHFAEREEQPGRDLVVDTPDPFPSGRWVGVATVLDRAAGKVRIELDGVTVADATCPDLPVHAT
ncbi:MAG: hypothetical protein JXR77_08845, partial [Lentisphaeria bacterium]|nr:hypothetical protein [Lentisphaeria bacterium]